MNIVIDYAEYSNSVLFEIINFLSENKIDIADLSLSDSFKTGSENFIPSSYLNDKLLNSVRNNHVEVLKNKFYCIGSQSPEQDGLCESILNDHIASKFMPSNQDFSMVNFDFYIRPSIKYINRLRIFLTIISFYHKLNFSINPNLLSKDNINIQILTPAQDDIYGISITQIIMALQRNRIPASDHSEEPLNGLFIPFEYSLDGMLSFLNHTASDTNLLCKFKDNFKTHDFSNLFK